MIANKLNSQKQKLVLAGGCFDLLHIGHITFLEKAKAQGDALFVLLESDEAIKKQKGPNRPLNSQTNRALVLSKLSLVDFVIKLPTKTNNTFYDDLALAINLL